MCNTTSIAWLNDDWAIQVAGHTHIYTKERRCCLDSCVCMCLLDSLLLFVVVLLPVVDFHLAACFGLNRGHTIESKKSKIWVVARRAESTS